MSADKSTASEGRNSQYQSPNPAQKLPSLQDHLSGEKVQTTENWHFSTKNLVPKISNMHLITNTNYQDGTITEESPRTEAEGLAKHKINYFQDRISAARESSLCNRKAIELETFPSIDEALILQLAIENNKLKKQKEVLNEKIQTLEREKQELIIALNHTERSLQETMKSHREEAVSLFRQLESYRENIQEGNQIASGHTSIVKSARGSNEHTANTGLANDVNELMRHIQKVESYSMELINSNFYLQAELNTLKRSDVEEAVRSPNKNIFELQKELDCIKKFIKQKFQLPQSANEVKSKDEDSAGKQIENSREDIREPKRTDREKKEVMPSMLKALYLGDTIGSPEKGTPRKP